MNSYKNTARMVGVLFIVATVASISTILFIGFLSEPDYLAQIAAKESQVLTGVFVEFIWALAVLGIPVLLYPILRKYGHAAALWFYSFRFIEAFLVILYSLSLLSLITLLGLSVPGLIAGSVIFETVFGLPGIGQLMWQSVMARDYPVVMGNLVFAAALTLVGNLLADLGYVAADPRISLNGGRQG